MAASTVTIEETAGERRKLALVGAGLPLRGAIFAGELRLATRWNPGNSREAVQHVLGATEAPSDWEGVWNTTRLVSSPCSFWPVPNTEPRRITRASELADLFESIIRSGVLLRVTWSSDDQRKIVREGRAGPYSFPYDGFDDVRWRVNFVWTSRGAGTARSPLHPSGDVEAAVREMQVALGEVATSIEAAKLRKAPNAPADAPTDESLGILESIGQEARAALDEVERGVAELREKTSDASIASELNRTEAGRFASTAASTARETAEQLKQTMDALGRMPPDGATSTEGTGKTLRIAAYFASVGTSTEKAHERALVAELRARKARTAASPTTARLDKLAPEDLLKTHVARAGETFTSISRRYYGTPDFAGEVAAASGFPPYQVSPPRGAIVLVPRRDSASPRGAR